MAPPDGSGSTKPGALQADWRSLCAQHTAYADLSASPGKCLAAMQLIGAGYKFLVDHWCEIGFLIEGENSGQPVCELCPRTCEVDAETAEAAGWVASRAEQREEARLTAFERDAERYSTHRRR